VELYRGVKKGFAEYFRSIGRKKPCSKSFLVRISDMAMASPMKA